MDRVYDFFYSAWNTVVFVVKKIGVADVLDMLIVAFIIYKLISVLKGSSAAKVAKGILLLLVVTGLSGAFRMNVLNFILSKTMELGFLALIIMFQPELRRLLERFGSSNFADILQSRTNVRELDKVIERTVKACGMMSAEKVGALIVFERNARLDDYMKTGTAIDAEVSVELLRNIFFPKAALHDGALIIRNGRVCSAGCMMPMSENPNLSRDLGMRHRAGIGVSERTDAVVIIVSEETGTISVAINGMLKRHLTEETLEKMLISELTTAESEDKTKKGGLLNWLKVKKDG